MGKKETRNEFDIIEFLKEIKSGTDLEKEIELVEEYKAEITAYLDTVDREKLSSVEKEVIDGLESMCKGPEEVNETDMVLEEVSVAVEVPMGYIIQDDLGDTIDGLPTGEFSNQVCSELINEIRGSSGATYDEKSKKAANDWNNNKNKRGRSNNKSFCR